MRSLHIPVLVLLALAPLQSSAQQPGRQQNLADSDSLRALVAQVPVLDMLLVELAPTVKLEGISAVVADRSGNIYVIHRPTDASGDPVVVLDKDGRFLRSWGRGMYTIPHGIEIGPDGSVWTTDANTSKIFRFSPQGEKLLEIVVGDIPETREGGFCSITDIAFHPQRPGHVFVSDGYCNGRVVEYDERGRKVQEFGSRGDGPGQFNNAHGIAVGPDGNIWVADRENGRVQWFDLTGKHLGTRRYGGQFYNVVFDSRGEMWAAVHSKGVSLDEEFEVVHFDMKTGKMLGRIPGRAHQLGIGFDGSIFPATRSDRLIVYRPKKSGFTFPRFESKTPEGAPQPIVQARGPWLRAAVPFLPRAGARHPQGHGHGETGSDQGRRQGDRGLPRSELPGRARERTRGPRLRRGEDVPVPTLRGPGV